MRAVRDYIQEIRELGVGGTLFRAYWELKRRGRIGSSSVRADVLERLPPAFAARIPYSAPAAVAKAVSGRVGEGAMRRVRAVADESLCGRVLAFSRWMADYGSPIDWHLNPLTGRRWNSNLPWHVGELEQPSPGDVKLTWEIGRFPHAYYLGRAAMYDPQMLPRYAAGMSAQIAAFRAAAPVGRGIHWSSGQEVAFRLLAWLFAARTLLQDDEDALLAMANELSAAATFVERHIEYARFAVYNNHLISEALLLYVAGVLLPEVSRAGHWRSYGRRLIETACVRQFYADGGYIQQSHNYHRVALQDLIWASLFAQKAGEQPFKGVQSALERSVEFLTQHQNPADGRLPNYGANDGALPAVLSTCDYADFRPTLQTASILARGARLYPEGPWDEEAVWLLGPEALETPMLAPARKSVSFTVTGDHVVRGRHEGSFGAFRCGSLRDRFSQIDMLHLDVWWRGVNVLVDGGSYLYNGPVEWHNYFVRTASHNTVTVDGVDQMQHHRKFKTLYWTRARLLQFEDHASYALVAGEHYGYRRLRSEATHRRSVLFYKDDVWVVVDHVSGSGSAAVRVHWLAGEFEFSRHSLGVTLNTPNGGFSVAMFDLQGRALCSDVRKGDRDPLRGWMSRYYGEAVAVPSIVADISGRLPATVVSILYGAGTVISAGDRWRVGGDTGHVQFSLSEDGRFRSVEVVE